MNFKTFKLASIVAISISLIGCSSTSSITWKCSIQGGPSQDAMGQCEIGGKIDATISKLVRPINTMLAETIGYSFSDWESSNFDEFSIKVDGIDSTIKDNVVTIEVYEGSYVIGSKSFGVRKVNGDYKFVSPTSIKEWAYNFVDTGTDVKVDFDIQHVKAGDVVVQAKHKNVVKAAASIYLPARGHDNPPPINDEIN